MSSKRGHVHSWQLTSSHPFGAVRRYRCTSCPATREERDDVSDFDAPPSLWERILKR